MKGLNPRDVALNFILNVLDLWGKCQEKTRKGLNSTEDWYSNRIMSTHLRICHHYDSFGSYLGASEGQGLEVELAG